MCGHRLHEARSEFSKLIDPTLAGEPRRVTWHGGAAIASEAHWLAPPKSLPTLADLFLKTKGEAELVGAIGDRWWATDERPFGADFADRLPIYPLDTSIVSLFDPRCLF